MSDTDGQLLQAFAGNRDEEAFRLLAKRHLGLVFHTALRRTGNRQLSEEISQNVLIALARKAASLAKVPDRLPAWLHRATLFESTKAMRAESSYQRRKQDGDAAAGPVPEDSGKAWLDALPYLDPALDKLPEADRRILLLHYFEEHPFPRIAEQLGKNVAAVQKQSQRALEKLSRILRTKGIALSVTALGAGLASQAAKAAVPEAFILSATHHALVATSTTVPFSLTAMIVSKPKVILPLLVLVLATPLGLQRIAIANQRDRLHLLEAELAASGKATLPRASQAGYHDRQGLPVASSSLDVIVLARELADARRIGGPTQRSFNAKLAALDEDTLAALILKAGSAPLGTNRTALAAALIATLAKTNSGLAVRTGIESFQSGPSLANKIAQTGLREALRHWADKEPAAALAWLLEMQESPKFASLNVHLPLGYQTHGIHLRAIDELRLPALSALSLGDAPQAAELLRSIPEKERGDLMVLSVRTLGAEGNGAWLPAYIHLMRDYLPEGERTAAWLKIGNVIDRSAIAPLLSSAGLAPQDRQQLADAIAYDAMLKAQARQWKSGAPSSADEASLEALRNLMPDQEEEILSRASAAAADTTASTAGEVLETLRRFPDIPEQNVRAILMNSDFTRHTEEAIECARRIEDPKIKQEVIDHLNAKARIFSEP